MTFEEASHSMESKGYILNLMRMSRETIGDNKQLVTKLECAARTGILEIRASTIRWILNVRGQFLSHLLEMIEEIYRREIN